MKVPCVLRVPSKGGRSSDHDHLVGKLIKKRDGTTIFFHAHGQSQWHIKKESPAAIDAVVLYWLQKQGIEWCYDYCREERMLRRISVAAALLADSEEWDDRVRHYPTDSAWIPFPAGPVDEERKGRETLYYGPGKRVVLTSPYTRNEVVIEPFISF